MKFFTSCRFMGECRNRAASVGPMASFPQPEPYKFNCYIVVSFVFGLALGIGLFLTWIFQL